MGIGGWVSPSLLLVLLQAQVALALVGRLDPCATPGKITKGGGFYIGLAFWPGGTVDDWGPVLNSTTQQLGLQPCLDTTVYRNDSNATHQEYLISMGVVFSSYEVRVDRMTVLRGNTTEQTALLESTTKGSQVISMVVFRGRTRSPARYFTSQNSSITGAVGAVQELATIVRIDDGDLTDLQWNDVTCGACGGRKSNRCITAQSSDAVQYSCSVGANCTASGSDAVPANLTDPCLPSVYLGFSGSDRHQRTFQSGYQITKINQFSLVAYYQRAASTLSNIYNTIALGGLGGSGVNDGGIGQGGGEGGGNEPAAR